MHHYGRLHTYLYYGTRRSLYEQLESFFFFFQAEDGIRDVAVTGVQTCALPIWDGEALIKVAACGVCGTDIKKIFHRYVEPPQILGHELAGTVVAVGRGVSKWKQGDRVMSFHHVPCGKCFYCERRLFSQCKQYKTTGLTAGFTPNEIGRAHV